MLKLLKSKIQALTDKDGMPVLNKHLGAGIFIVMDDSRSISPIQPEYIEAIKGLNNLQATDFNEKKMEILDIINTLILSKERIVPGRSESLDEVMYGKTKNSIMKELKYRLLLVEQNNIDYFKDREPLLTSSPHDRLVAHMMLRWGSDKVEYWFTSEELPISIRDEVSETFKGMSSYQPQGID